MIAPTPPAVGGLDLQVLVQADESAALLADDLGPHLVRHSGSHEDLIGDDATRLGLEDHQHRVVRAVRRTAGGSALDHLRRW